MSFVTLRVLPDPHVEDAKTATTTQQQFWALYEAIAVIVNAGLRSVERIRLFFDKHMRHVAAKHQTLLILNDRRLSR